MHDLQTRTALAPLRRPGCALTLPVLGIPTRFESNSAEVIEIAEEAFGAWRTLEAEPEWIEPRGVRVRVTVRRRGAGPEAGPPRYRTPRPDLLLAATGESRGRVDARAREAGMLVTDALVADPDRFVAWMLEALTLALLSRLDRQPLHAAAVVRGGTTLLLAGPSGVGKSSLTYAAMRSGLRVLTEDTAFLQLAPFRVWGMPGSVHLSAASARFFPELHGVAPVLRANGKRKVAVELRETWARPARQVATRAGICLLQRGDGRPGLRRVAGAEVVRALTTCIEPGFDFFADSIGERVHRAAAGGAWALALPDHPADAVPLLHEMLDAVEDVGLLP